VTARDPRVGGCTVCNGLTRRPSGAGDSDPCHACAGTGKRHMQVAQSIFDEGWAAAVAQMQDAARRSDPPPMRTRVFRLAEQLGNRDG
jgi:hypothetical protein